MVGMKSQTINFSVMRKLETFDILTEVSWIWVILDMEKEFSWKS